MTGRRKEGTIRALTAADFFQFYGRQPPQPVRGLALEHEGEVLAVIGVHLAQVPLAFSDMKEGAEISKRERVRSARAFASILDRYPFPVYATADPELPTAKTLLEHLGFQETADGGLFIRSA